MATDEKWYFTKEQLAITPSRKCGIDADKELSYRQQAANFIQDMGQRLSVTQLCINTAIVYMHRFYVFHSLSHFHRNAIATAALFLAAKVEEQPRKLEHVIKVAHICLHKDQSPPDVRSEQYLEQAQDVVFNENVLLQTLGFDVAIDHPHTHVVRCCHLVKASKDLAQASYFMASNSLHMTTMCLQYKPTVVACFCIHLACKWSNWEIPQSNEGKHWFWYVDRSVTAELLQQLTAEFLHIFDNCPSRLKRRVKSIAKESPGLNRPSLPNSPFDAEYRQVSPANDGGPTFQSARPFPVEESKKQSSSSSSSATATATTTSSSSSRPPVDYREYREKKERERLEREKAAGVGNTSGTSVDGAGKSHHSHSHHAKQQAAQASAASGKHPGGPGSKPVSHHNHHGAHRSNEGKPSGQQPSQRHSSSSASGATSQSGRPRLPRDYNATIAANSAYSHAHQAKDNSLSNVGVTDITGLPDMSINPLLDGNHGMTEKTSTNHSRLDVKHDKSQSRGYDPRHKILEHGLKDTEQKNYTKYQQQQEQRGRKVVDPVEQRSEEVRKLIEKPLPLPKGSLRPEIPVAKEDYMANMLKQSHNSKYGQQQIGEKTAGNPANAAHIGNMSRNPQDYPMPGSRDKNSSSSSSKSLQLQQQQLLAGVPLVSNKYEGKSTVKNGNSQQISGGNGLEDSKPEKSRPRHQADQEDRLQAGGLMNQQQTPVNAGQHGVLAQPVKQHKSLFSPEKVSNPRESHPRISRSSRQKTSPSSVASSLGIGNSGVSKATKQHDRISDQPSNNDLPAFGSPHTLIQPNANHQPNLLHPLPHHHHHHHHHHHQNSLNPQEQTMPPIKTSSHSKRHRTSSIGDSSKGSLKIEQSAKIEVAAIKTEPTSIKQELPEIRENDETMKMLGRIPELIQPIRDNPTSTNGRGGAASAVGSGSGAHGAGNSVVNDLKPPELIKPFEPEPILRHTTLSNGLDPNVALKTEPMSQDSGYSGSLSRSSQDYLSPLRSAQSISALLQEPLAPMPSLLQGIPEFGVQQNSTQLLSAPPMLVEGSQQQQPRSYQYVDPQDSLSRDNRQPPGGGSGNGNRGYHQSGTAAIGIGMKIENDDLSTVDISALSAPQQTIPDANQSASQQIVNISSHQQSQQQQLLSNPAITVTGCNDYTTTSITTATTTATAATTATTPTTSTTASTPVSTSTTPRKSDNHKSDKKKKKEKRKHREKDKIRDRKKHKHKDKDKEKHIKITIPKDKLNLSSDASLMGVPIVNTIINEKKSPQTATTTTGLKIKIPKERLKGADASMMGSGTTNAASASTTQILVQAPLKFTIRTNAGENSESSVSLSSSRKRDRGDDSSALVAPPLKKQHPTHHHHHHHHPSANSSTTTTPVPPSANQQQQQVSAISSFQGQSQGQRLNGRHSSSNNKEKHSSSHHKSSSKLSQQQQQLLLLQQQQQQQQHHHHQQQHPHPT